MPTSLLAQGESAAFIDGASHRYLRDQQDDQVP
jgi:hypothetical protein